MLNIKIYSGFIAARKKIRAAIFAVLTPGISEEILLFGKPEISVHYEPYHLAVHASQRYNEKMRINILRAESIRMENDMRSNKVWGFSKEAFFVAVLFCACLISPLFLASCRSAENSGVAGKPVSSATGTEPSGSKAERTEGKSSESGSIASSSGDTAETAPASSEVTEQAIEQQVQQKLSEMTLAEKVAQLFLITPNALTGCQKVTAAGSTTRAALQKYPVGGLIYFDSNIVTPDQLKAMTANTQKYAMEMEGIPLFLALDEEGGTVARIGNNPNFKVKQYTDMALIGASRDPQKAYEVGATIGSYLSEYGLNLDFAPDADVLTNPSNTVIGNRSFGTDAALVAEMDLQVSQGLADHHVLSCFKHFPGHGATAGDTHKGFAYTNKSLEELRKSELVPFQAAAQHNIPFLMVSHISVPNVIGDNTPSSLSKVMITDILRNRLGYNGIIITDSMSMGAIVNNYGTKESVLRSLQAGADMILMPQDFKTAYQAVLSAVSDGSLSEQRIEESVKRILRVKLGLKQ